MDDNKSIKEFYLVEGKALFLGILNKLDEPIIINGRLITEGIVREKCTDFGIIHRTDCLNVLQGFESSTLSTLIPNESKQDIMLDNGKFRLMVVDKPLTPNGFNIQYREYEAK